MRPASAPARGMTSATSAGPGATPKPAFRIDQPHTWVRNRIEPENIAENATLAVLGAGVVLAVAFVAHQRRSPAPRAVSPGDPPVFHRQATGTGDDLELADQPLVLVEVDEHCGTDLAGPQEAGGGRADTTIGGHPLADAGTAKAVSDAAGDVTMEEHAGHTERRG